jgi:hypothetical protein
MEAIKDKMKNEKNHKHQDLITQQMEKDEVAKSQVVLEAQLKAQEYREMLKRLK